MNVAMKLLSVSVPVLILTCFLTLPESLAQQVPSSHFGVGPATSSSSGSASFGMHSTASTGISTWGGGKASAGFSAQLGGVWRDEGPMLGSATRAVPRSTQAKSTEETPFQPSGGISSGSLSPSPAGFRKGGGMGALHATHSVSGGSFASSKHGQRGMPKSSGMNHAGSGSRGRIGAKASGFGSEEKRSTTGLTTRLGLDGLPKESGAGSSLHNGLDTGLDEKALQSLP